jgi:hypothetical protein
MTTDKITQSHVRDLVSQLTHEDPTAAAVFMRLSVLTDPSTPKGAALRRVALVFAYSLTDDCREAMEKFVEAA